MGSVFQSLFYMIKFDAIIVANGEFPTHTIPLSLLKEAGCIICCDGATNKLSAAGFEPDIIVGDLDSISSELKALYAEKVVHVKSQDDNDLTKAVNLACKKGFKNIAITGATGLRADHTIGNIFLLATYIEKAVVTLFTDDGTFEAANKTTSFESFSGQQVSIFAVNPTTKISSKGLRYALNQMQLTSPWMGTLNEADGSCFELKFDDGELIVYQSYEKK
ncbi:thiamine diphosphokinase [Prolixibacteraceae bacterium JC049]|nr:thiamine diphosphokinase [Prolixibacteraceae bacterium JC049]